MHTPFKLIVAAALACIPVTSASASHYVSLETATAISDAINLKMVFVPEAAGRDDWQEGQATGDCEDFALTKRSALIAAGMPADKLRVLVLRNRSGGHAVLAVRFNRMQYVFERYSTPSPVALTAYLRATRFKVFCEARDLAPGDKPASARC